MYFTNGFYLYPKYLKLNLMAHYCNFAGKGEPAAALPPSGVAAGGLPPGRGVAGPSRRLNLNRQCGSAALDVVLNILDRNKNS